MRRTCSAIGALLLLTAQMLCGAQSSERQRVELAAHLSAAQRFLSEKQPARAIPELRAAVALDPANLDARANLGVLLYFQGQFAESVPELRAAVQAKPDLWKIRALLGIAERRTGAEDAGRADLEAVFPELDQDTKLKISAGRELIESYAASDEFDRASEMIGRVLKLDPANPALLYISYRIHSQMAAAAMIELGLDAPGSAETHQAMAHELQRDRDLPGVIANLRAALRIDPNLPGIHFELAEALHASDDQRLRAESEEQYRLAVASNPSDAKAATRMGDLEVEKGDLDAGSAYYARALKLQAAAAEAKVGLANVLSEQGKPGEAASLLEEVVAADPSNVLAHYRLSAVYRRLQRPDDVKRELALYQKYKTEREDLKKVYRQMRLATPQSNDEKE